MKAKQTTTQGSNSLEQRETDNCAGSNYLGAMRIATEMIDMAESYDDLLQLLAHVTEILHGSRIEAIFPPSE